MTRLQLLERVKARRKELGITIDNLAQISHLGYKTLSRFFAGSDVKLSTVEKVTQVLGLDFAGNETVSIDDLRDKRAEKKAIYIISLVQDTSALEMQGLESDAIKILIADTKKEFLVGEYKKNLWAS
ncbi:MAG: helix-turn-helix transcriptional regulator [Campylobacteraceae bacterium]|nr:helix-turn-helix transcriptional regulator [Campylobacteraceae bacterium]